MSAVKQLIKPVSKAKLHKLEELQCKVFRTTYNPQKERTGAKILTKPLKGQTLANYYGPADFPSPAKMLKLWKQEDYAVVDEVEEYRANLAASRRKRGKGAPKKKKEKADGKKKK